LVCPHCKKETQFKNQKEEDECKVWWNEQGKYIPTNPQPQDGYRSFRVPALPLLRYPWSDLVREWLLSVEQFNADASPAAITNFLQQRNAENVAIQDLYDMRDKMVFYSYDILSDWKEAKARFLILDYQEGSEKDNKPEHFWCLVADVSERGDSRLLWFGKLPFDPSLVKEKQKEFNVPNNRVFMDVGKNMTKLMVICAKHGWFGTKGEGNPKAKALTWSPVGASPTKQLFSDRQVYPTGVYDDKNKQYVGYYFFFDVNEIKCLLDQIRRGKTPVKMHRPTDNKVYIDQMDSEYWKNEEWQGTTIKRWYPKRKRANHGFDLEVYLLGVMLMYGYNDKCRLNIMNTLLPSLMKKDDEHNNSTISKE
jgi:phage terminase large subunit GpA-like protein